MNEKDAILLIEEMISKTKEEIRDNGFYYYFWGWLVFIAALADLYILGFTTFEIHGLPWMILMPLGGIVTMIYGMREKKKDVQVKTYVSESMNEVVRAFSISLFVVCFAMPVGAQWKAFYPTIMMVYAIWLFVSGGLLKFKPLKWGGILNWACALIGFIYPEIAKQLPESFIAQALGRGTEVHLLLIAIGVMGGFIIPGHLLNNRLAKHV